jgi:hypothetical protein
MDFRSQLSAFKNKSSNNSNAGNNDLNSDRGRGSSSRQGNSNNNFNSANNHYNNNRYGSPNRGGGYHDAGYGGDRRRHRPREWNQNPNYHQGPASRRRLNPPPRHGSPGQHGYGHGPPNLDGLGELRNLGYQIPRGFPPVPTEDEKGKKSKHLALLAISIDDLPYEDIWKGWCETLSSSLINSDKNVDDYFISLVCHAKFPNKVKSEWLRQRLLTYPPKQGRGNSFMDPVFLSRTPEWGSVEITRAMLDLLQDGLKIGNVDKNSIQFEDKRFSAGRYLVRSPPSFNASEESTNNAIPPVDHFLFISESCIPVVTAPELFSKISDSNVSWLNACHRTESDTPKNKYEDDQFAGINRRIPGQYRWKGDQWVLLSKRHASTIIGMDRPFKPAKHQLWQSFRNINASDEMFFPTALALLGDLRYTKDGFDTQKGRSRDEESSKEGGPVSASLSPAASNTPGQNQSNNETDVLSPAAKSSPPTQNQSIILKPVTYTDWTEGMRNPATFSNGRIDLKRVGKLARDGGCLVARKFATHVNIPGIPLEEQKLTGCISMEEWTSVITEIQNEEEKKKVAVQEVDAATVTPKSNEAKDFTTEQNEHVDDKKSESLETNVEGQESENISGDPEDNDNDEEENQLE